MSQNIRPKWCGYNCQTRIYWDDEKQQYLELMSKKKHICPNRQKYAKPKVETDVKEGTAPPRKLTYPKMNYYENKTQQQQAVERPKMSNSFELITGSIRDMRKQYEYLSELIREAGGKVHGSQRGQDAERITDIIVYYEVPELSKLGVQDKFDKFVIDGMAK